MIGIRRDDRVATADRASTTATSTTSS